MASDMVVFYDRVTISYLYHLGNETMDQSSDRLNFGIMCNGTVFDRWQSRCLETLRDNDQTELKLLIVDDRSRSEDSTLKNKVRKFWNYT